MPATYEGGISQRKAPIDNTVRVLSFQDNDCYPRALFATPQQ